MSGHGDLLERLEALEAELSVLRAERRKPTSSAWRRSPWLSLPMLVVAVWMLSAAAPDLEPRVAALERLIRKGTGGATQVTTPFEVVGPSGKQILRVGAEVSKGALVAIGQSSSSRGGQVSVNTPEGREILAMGADKNGEGQLTLADLSGHVGALLKGYGRIAVIAPKTNSQAGMIIKGDIPTVEVSASGGSVARLSTTNGTGEVAVLNSAGHFLAKMGADAQNGGAGGVKVMTTAGKVTAALLGGVRGAGAVVVANSAAKPVAELSVAQDGRGLVQVFSAASKPIAVLTQAVGASGGLLQISQTSGISVANLTVGEGGGGYLQLSNPAGQPTVEGGTLGSGKGYIRAGPIYKCGSNLGFGVVGGAVLPPDCIVGLSK